MRILEFYRGETETPYAFDDVIKWKDSRLEGVHDYIQWLFPTDEPSMFNEHAPVLSSEDIEVFREDPELQSKMLIAFSRMLEFYEFQLVIKSEGIAVEPVVQHPMWLRSFNHNFLRVTRILKSLRLCGLEDYAEAFLKGLLIYEDYLSDETVEYWKG